MTKIESFRVPKFKNKSTSSAAPPKNILRGDPQCLMRGLGYSNCKTNCETNRTYWHEHGDT